MLFDLPDHQTLYAALLARDDRFDGQAFVCVSSTGVFCRLICPARKPKLENCTFFASIKECIEAGYRACRRCHPLRAAALADPVIAALLHALEERPNLRWSDPIILYNVRDAGSARAVEEAEAKAIATGSWSVAAAQGYEDGEAIPLDDALAAVARITRSVDLPVTVDFEGGYATDPDRVGQNIRRLPALGVIGLNFEDQMVNGPGLHSIDDQVARLRAIRDAADAMEFPVFINARTDVFLRG